MKRGFSLFVAAALRAACAFGAGTEVALIDAAKPVEGWGFGRGEEFPGAKGSLSVADEVESVRRPALKLAADFTGGGNYVQMGHRVASTEVESLSLWVKAPKGSDGFTLRLIDGTKQCHQLPIRIKPSGEWQQIVFPVTDYFDKVGTSAALDFVGRYENWGGANDGKWHQPLTDLYVLVGRHVLGEPKKGELLFSDLRIRPPAPTREVLKSMPLTLVRDDGTADWKLNLGWEFKGAKGVLAAADAAGETVLRFAGDFTEGGAYVSAEKEFPGLDFTSLKMQAKTSNMTGFRCRLVDGSGQCHQSGTFKLQTDGQWHEVEIPVSAVVGGEHWGGANDGKWHGPAKLFALVMNSGHARDKQPSVLLKDMTACVKTRVAVAGESYTEKFGGKEQLALVRTEDEMLAENAAKGRWTGTTFAATEGLWNLCATSSGKLHSPDSSFCVRLTLECLDAAGAKLEQFEIVDQFGTKDWSSVSKTCEFPSGTAKARFVARFEKTWGSAAFKDVSATPVERVGGEKLVSRILIDGRKTVDGKKRTNGHLFLPEESLDFELGVQTLKALPKNAAALVTACDYWGAEIVPPRKVALTSAGRAKNLYAYTANYTVPKASVEVGRYYELQVKVAVDDFAPATEISGFARLPEAEAKQYPAREIPFQIRNWDSRIREYFDLADRIGHRNIGLWGDSGWDYVESLGDMWYTGAFAHEVEVHGWKNTTPQEVYQKTFDLVAKHKNDKFWFICQGNEPNEKPELAKEKVEAYEQVYKAAHAAKPDITVVATSVPALDCFFKEGFGKWCDVYDFHVYESYADVRRGVRRYRELGKKYGREKPVWCTELGLNSQGQTRLAVAREVVKKITSFFAEGGASVSWFTIQYPDGEGKARGTGGNCHNVFDCQYNLFNPRLDALMYYAMINNITVKKFVDEVQHADGVQDYLFRDANGDSFRVLWKEGDRVDCGIPLPKAREVVLTRIDGSQETLVPAQGAVTLGISTDPVLLRYRDTATKLAKKRAPAAMTIDAREDLTVSKGGTCAFVVKGAGLKAADLVVQVPPQWSAKCVQKAVGAVTATVTAPQKTGARAGRVLVQKRVAGKTRGEIALTLTVK